MIFKNNVGCDGLITFWSIPDHSCFTPSLQPIIHHLYNQIFLGTWGRDSYFKVGQCFFQSWAKVVSKWGSCLKVQGNGYTSKHFCFWTKPNLVLIVFVISNRKLLYSWLHEADLNDISVLLTNKLQNRCTKLVSMQVTIRALWQYHGFLEDLECSDIVTTLVITIK